jgi:ribonucleoside-diphosphate reductase alpha chain
VYQFENDVLEYGRGSLAELISYDRYSITSNNIYSAKVNDVVIFLKERTKETQIVGTILQKMNDPGVMVVEAHDGSGVYTVCYEDARLVKELKPSQLWDRWAKGAASVEHVGDRGFVEDSFRWLLDGYRYVPGGRIQNMLGQEFAGFGLDKSKLSAYNCLVLPSPVCDPKADALSNWLRILEVCKREANSMAFGCGVGINVSTVPENIEGPETTPVVRFVLGEEHAEHAGLTSNNFAHGLIGKEAPVEALIEVQDSRFGIFNGLMQMVACVYEGMNVAMDFSKLRAKGSYVKGIDGTSSGAISWMKLFDFVVGLLKKPFINAVDVSELYALIPHLISQGGQRRGALMLVLNVDHPNIVEFITVKQTSGRLTGANLSVNLTDEFMKLESENDPYAVELFDLICKLAHKSAEPGILFMDRAQKLCNTSYYQTIDAVNPCSEQPLPPNGVCNLAHLNLPRFLVKKGGRWDLDYVALERAIKLGVRFSDNILDYTSYFDDDIKAIQEGDRRIGLGTMGLATVLIYMGIRYGSHEAKGFATHLNRFIATRAYETSIKLGEERGSFPNYDPTKISETSFLYKITNGKIPATLRNAALLTQAPTGSTGTVIDNLPDFDCSTGVEPYFDFEYWRASRVGETVKQEVDLARKWRAEHPDEENLPSYFVGASEISPREHVLMQSSIQKFVDSALSKTINMPSHATVEDVKEAYLLAYETGCKGVTVYRDGCRTGQVLATKKEDAKLEDLSMGTDVKHDFRADKEFAPKDVSKEIKKRPHKLYGQTIRQNTPLGKMYVTINNSGEDLVEEIFIQLGQVGSDIRAIVDSLGVLLTLGLSDRLSSLPQDQKLQWLIDKLIGIKGSNPIGFGPTRVDSLPDALGKLLRDYVGDIVDEAPAKELTIAYDLCPACGEAAVRQIEGCEKCTNCGASKCG